MSLLHPPPSKRTLPRFPPFSSSPDPFLGSTLSQENVFPLFFFRNYLERMCMYCFSLVWSLGSPSGPCFYLFFFLCFSRSWVRQGCVPLFVLSESFSHLNFLCYSPPLLNPIFILGFPFSAMYSFFGKFLVHPGLLSPPPF